jgi:ankyrin repeat protein
MHAARSGPAALVRALLHAGARVDVVDCDGNQPLWQACAGDDPEVVDLIIAAGADLDHANLNGFTALMYSASASKARALRRLLAAGADLGIEVDGMTALDMAATFECLQLLRAAGRRRS